MAASTKVVLVGLIMYLVLRAISDNVAPEFERAFYLSASKGHT